MTSVVAPRIAAAEVRLRKTRILIANQTKKKTLRVWRQSLPPPAPGTSIMAAVGRRQAATTVTASAILRVCRDKRDEELREKSLKDVNQASKHKYGDVISNYTDEPI